MADRPEEISTEKARGAVVSQGVRYVLIISLVLAVAAMVFALIESPKGTQDGPTTAAGPQ